MKKLLIAFMSIFLLVGTISAQDSPKKMLKKASKNLSKYYQNPAENEAKLTEALELVKAAFESDEAKTNPDAWNTKGKIYNELANAEVKASLLNPEYLIKYADAAQTAYQSFTKGLELGTKKGHKKDALKGMEETIGHLINSAITTYNVKDYASAFNGYKNTLELHDLLKANDAKSPIVDDAQRQEYMFYGAVAGYYGDMKTEATPLFIELADAGYDHALIYEALFSIKCEKNPQDSVYLSDLLRLEDEYSYQEGLKFLQMGRTKYPDDTGLLFAEINYYLKSGQLEILTDKLKIAIEKEPNNVTVRNTLGNVYDQLYQSEDKAGNTAKSIEYFDLAYDYYNQALAIDDKNFDATYSLGALYYNKAASYTDKINELSNDFSAAGTKKYDAMKAEMDSQFAKARPYFISSEQLNPADGNPLIALKEIYARANEFEKVAEYKAKIEALGK
ncbi:MAG: hypothetical protein QNL00_05510 [Saprospiraceae bacterium]